MNKIIFPALFIFLFATKALGQSVYDGTIGKYSIELVTNIFSDGDARAVYMYKSHNDPIIINGRLNNGVLTLSEKDSSNTNCSTLTFNNYSPQADTLTGIWENLKTQNKLSIVITKKFDITYGDSIEWKDKEIIQSVSLKDYFFKIVTEKVKGEFYAKVTGVKIIQKKNNSLYQFIPVDGELSLGLDNISVDDYNFDGLKDFSIFEQSYTGPNTSSIYFLFNPRTKKFFNSGFDGVSLEFDSTEKRIYETNQCCEGKIHTTATYKVVNNKMVLVEQHCFVWSEKKQELVERKMIDCQ